MYEVNIKWIDKQRYVATGHSGHAIILDIPTKSGGTDSGLHATELFLIAIGKCSAVDVVNILKKQRTNLTRLEVIVTGDISKDYPKHYKRIQIIYIASGDGVTKEKVEKAVKLSHGKYCTLSNSLSENCEVTTKVEIVS